MGFNRTPALGAIGNLGLLFPPLFLAAMFFPCHSFAATKDPSGSFPLPLERYHDQAFQSLFDVLAHRASVEPLNVFAAIIFGLAIIHTFFAPRIFMLAKKMAAADLDKQAHLPSSERHLRIRSELLHFLGEVEVVFAIWVIPLLVVISLSKGWDTVTDYLENTVVFNEPIFVTVIMTMAASRPIIAFAETILKAVARLTGGGVSAWWLAILTIGPISGSFITEPAAMTISAVLLAQHFYSRKPSSRLRYATIGLLFVNISAGGLLTNFAAPLVRMVAARWGWSTPYMFLQFGWRAVAGVLVATAIYFVLFRKELRMLNGEAASAIPSPSIPLSITAVHLLFLAFTVIHSHHPVFVIGGFLVFLAFTEATRQHQSRMALRPPLLVGLFLAGLVIHGMLQGWWIEPLLVRFNQNQLLAGAALLTAFNDNVAITYLASLVPSFASELRYVVVAGAAAGGGLTLIASAPNPAGYSILRNYFPAGFSPLALALSAVIPTVVMLLIFAL